MENHRKYFVQYKSCNGVKETILRRRAIWLGLRHFIKKEKRKNSDLRFCAANLSFWTVNMGDVEARV